MYVRPDLLTTLQPKITGWFAHKNPFAFEVDHFELREDSYRLANGTPAIAALYSIQPGIDIIAQVGVDNIRAKSLRQTDMIFELADAAGYETRTPRDPEFRAGTVTVNPPHAYEVSRELLERGFIVDFRANAGIRIAPHFYNSDEEVRACMAAITETLSAGAWEKHAQKRDFVT
jgi:kynureninase